MRISVKRFSYACWGAAEIRATKVNEAHGEVSPTARLQSPRVGRTLGEVGSMAKSVLTNSTYMALTFYMVCDKFIVGALMAYGTKVFQYLLNMPPTVAGVAYGNVTVLHPNNCYPCVNVRWEAVLMRLDQQSRYWYIRSMHELRFGKLVTKSCMQLLKLNIRRFKFWNFIFDTKWNIPKYPLCSIKQLWITQTAVTLPNTGVRSFARQNFFKIFLGAQKLINSRYIGQWNTFMNPGIKF